MSCFIDHVHDENYAELYFNYVADCLCAAFMIAGNTGEYVNSELEKVATRLVSGDR